MKTLNSKFKSSPWRTLLASSVLMATSAYGQVANVGDEIDDEETIVLSPFEVSSEQDVGYLATSTLAGTRIDTKLEDVGVAISVITQEFLEDLGATDNEGVLAYTLSTEIGAFKIASRFQSLVDSVPFPINFLCLSIF